MTISIKIKEIMANMPDTLNTKKEVDYYYKKAMAKVIKDNKADIENKPKKELNGYQKFMKENIGIIKSENPKLTGPEVFSIIAAKWKKEKEANGAKVEENVKEDVKEDVKNEEDVKEDIKEDVKEDTKVEEDVKADVKEVVKEVKKKDKKAK
jgi:hypothetical protein